MVKPATDLANIEEMVLLQCLQYSKASNMEFIGVLDGLSKALVTLDELHITTWPRL